MAGTALRRRLSWQIAEVAESIEETPHVRSLVLDAPDWPGHRAGQHVDVRLTAEDGYQAVRSYSIASAPADGRLVITVERLGDGEVSPYLVDELHASWPGSHWPPDRGGGCTFGVRPQTCSCSFRARP